MSENEETTSRTDVLEGNFSTAITENLTVSMGTSTEKEANVVLIKKDNDTVSEEIVLPSEIPEGNSLSS